MKLALDASVLLTVFNQKPGAQDWIEFLIRARRQGSLPTPSGLTAHYNAPMPSDSWSEAFACHTSAVASFASAAEAVEPSAWHVPRAEGKWSPALITGHLIRTYDVLIAEVGGQAGMKIRLPVWKRLFLRLTLMPRLLRGGAFPKQVPAPPEIRPTEAPPDPASGAALFRQRAQEFETAVHNARTRKPPARITHAYFGAASLPKAVLFCARHIDHHRAQLGRMPMSNPGAARRV